jgi:glycosyltransferase involved in cell wall biosynthesis
VIKISVQMCTYNRRHLLERALKALFNQNFPKNEFEIVLVDDGSTDGTGEYIKTVLPTAPCRITYIHQENSGLAHGRNQGIRHARGHIILFIDDDIVASPNLLAEHVATHEKYPDHVVRGWVNHTDNLDDIEGPRFNMQDISTAFFWTSNVSASRKHLLQAGLFDEDFREYGWEDLELGIRLKRLGLGMKYNKRAVVYHYKSRWTAADAYRLCRQAQSKGRTAVIFVDKHPTWRVRLATGLHWPRLLMHRIFSLGGLIDKFYDWVLQRQGDKVLTGFALMIANQKVIFTYFQTIIHCLRVRARTGALPPPSRNGTTPSVPVGTTQVR